MEPEITAVWFHPTAETLSASIKSQCVVGVFMHVLQMTYFQQQIINIKNVFHLMFSVSSC